MFEIVHLTIYPVVWLMLVQSVYLPIFSHNPSSSTYTTHMYLLAGEDPPVCISCQENLTVEHILIHCAEYFHVRYQCFDVNNLGELFRTVSPNIITQFIQRAGLFYLI